MSFATWKAEFYPKDAHAVSRRGALEHSIRKWTGLLKSNLKKHRVRLALGLWGLRVGDDLGGLPITDSSCALCVHHEADDNCGRCPLYAARGMRCDRSDGGSESPYGQAQDGNVVPMLRLFRKCRPTKATP